MPDEPYRQALPREDDELARLARQGNLRIQAAQQGRSAEARVEETRHLRVAIGAVRGSFIKRAAVGLMVLGIASMAAGIALTAATGDGKFGPFIPVGFFVALGSFMFHLFFPPLATNAQVEAERQSMASLPFFVEGYFDVLSAEPAAATRLEIVMAFSDPMSAEPQTVQGLMGLLDTDAQVARTDGSEVAVRTGSISGATGIRVNGVHVHRNHLLAKYLRRVVEQVLTPLHRSRSLRGVRITRTHSY